MSLSNGQTTKERLLDQPLRMGSLTLPNRAICAPLAGISDAPFRRICQELGAGLTYVEMLSAQAMHYKNKRTIDMMYRHPSEPLLGVQITGPTPEMVGEAIRFVDGFPFDTIDINMGCPVRKVVASGSGSGILRDPERLGETVHRAREATSKPLSVKVRLGFSRHEYNVGETSRRAAREGIDMFTVHGRTRCENYGNRVDLEGIAEGLRAAREAATRPLAAVGNGDVLDFRSAARMHEVTGCDAVMISRGAMGNPWIFREVREGRDVQPTIEEWLDVVWRHMDYQQEHYPTKNLAAILFRKHWIWYAKGFPDTRELLEKLRVTESMDDARAWLKAYAGSLPAGVRRFELCPRGDDRFGSRYDPKYDMDRERDRGVGALGMG